MDVVNCAMLKNSPMNKLIQMRLIGLASLTIEQLTPITKVRDSTLYALLLHKFERFQRWRNTKKISQKEFEKHLHRSQKLIDDYIEVYDRNAGYYKCEIIYSQAHFDYYVMMKNDKIVFFFFHISKSKITHI